MLEGAATCYGQSGFHYVNTDRGGGFPKMDDAINVYSQYVSLSV